jgi:hypothetical protein
MGESSESPAKVTCDLLAQKGAGTSLSDVIQAVRDCADLPEGIRAGILAMLGTVGTKGAK